MRFSSIKKLLSLGCLFTCFCLVSGSSLLADDALHAPSALAAEQLRVGTELEINRQWLEAVQHYEKACRAYHDHAELKRRLLISRIHYDVTRRCQDPSLLDAMATISVNDGLELYSEVLSRLEMSYVETIDMTEIVRGGTAYLEVALTEPLFVNQFLRGQDPQKIEQFRTSIHRVTLARPVRTRFEARNTLANVAAMAKEQIGLAPSATIMQFVCGAVGLLDPYSSFLSAGELAEVESQIEGNFVGLGIALQPHEVPLRILNVITVVLPKNPVCKSATASWKWATFAVPMWEPNGQPICCEVQKTVKCVCLSSAKVAVSLNNGLAVVASKWLVSKTLTSSIVPMVLATLRLTAFRRQLSASSMPLFMISTVNRCAV